MSATMLHSHICTLFFPFLLLLSSPAPAAAINSDGLHLLAFRGCALSDPFSVLQSWNSADATPCAWRGVTCSVVPHNYSEPRVVSLLLPNSHILGSVPADLGNVEHLRILDLSGNFLNGSLPTGLFSASELTFMSLADNEISGELPELVGRLTALESLNLSHNALSGRIPQNLSLLPNLSVLSLSTNYFSGELPWRFPHLKVLDLSQNLLTGTPSWNLTGDDDVYSAGDGAGAGFVYLNLSGNSFSGDISPEFASKILANASVDFSFNNFTGVIPEALVDQEEDSFLGNPNLCGKPLKKLCVVPSTLSVPPNVTSSVHAIAVMPRPLTSPAVRHRESSSLQQPTPRLMKPVLIAGLIVGDLAGIGIVSVIFLFIYESKKKKKKKNRPNEASMMENGNQPTGGKQRKSSKVECCCLREEEEDDDTSETTGSDTGDEEGDDSKGEKGSLVTLDGGPELEMETLLKASAYILSATSSGIVYKAVMEDGTTFAVRRVGGAGGEQIRDFVNHVRQYSKLRHPNVVSIRGYYSGDDEKLIIYDYVTNGSLASWIYRKMGSSPLTLSWDSRLKIATGVARGLAYIHDRKYVHGNLKPSNILLELDMEPKVGDLGLERLLSGDYMKKTSNSSSLFGSSRSTLSQDSLQEDQGPVGASPASSSAPISPYHAPESLKYLKPTFKRDVYSFGIVLLELLTGKVVTEHELASSGFICEDRTRVMKMVDLGLRPEIFPCKEEAILTLFKLGFNCASVIPQKRPTMKEALHVLEKILSSTPL